MKDNRLGDSHSLPHCCGSAKTAALKIGVTVVAGFCAMKVYGCRGFWLNQAVAFCFVARGMLGRAK